MLLLTQLVALAAIALTGSASGTPRTLSDSELLNLLSGTSVTIVNDEGHSVTTISEVYLSNGRYILYGGRIRHVGQYTVSNGIISYSLTNTSMPSASVVHENGRYYYVRPNTTQKDLLQLEPVNEDQYDVLGN